ncbi:MAG TPA: glycosyltransferase [Nitrososphaeraceae archaeon]|nr:glycosyltransferase [Nitrososphaeraceae archaeon]
MAIDFYALWNSSNNNNTIESLLLILFTIIIASWLYLFIISFKSYLLVPMIQPKQERTKFLSSSSLTKENTITSINDNVHYFSKKKRSTNDSSIYPFVSVIVPARNEQDHIKRCLLSLLAQNYPNFEVIAIDDSSTDNTLKIMKEIEKKVLPKNRLKIISLIHKPDNWTGKTWASQQGYLQSSGSILLFTDADTNYNSKDTILLTISYMQKQNLDVLTGIAYTEALRDFWSKIILPLWSLVNVLFDVNRAEVNNPKSKVAYLMGSFFLIHKTVFEEIGTFQSVRNAIQEDRALGVRIKEAGYKMRIVRLDGMMSARWSRDIHTLWHGIGRTLAPIAIKKRSKVVVNLIIIFFISALPFVTLPYTLSIAVSTKQSSFISALPFSVVLPPQFDFQLLLLLNVVSCLMVIIGSAIKGVKEYKLTPLYSLLTFFAAIFLTIAFLYNTIPLLMSNKAKPIIWRGRKYVYDTEEKSFAA